MKQKLLVLSLLCLSFTGCSDSDMENAEEVTSGYYYDYIGIDKEKRYSVYDKLVEIINNYGFDYLDLRDKEYVPYFYKDVMHFGWKGWLYVDEQITKYYK